jgi:UDP-N-acetylglucosamine acyltransferase
MPHVHPTAVLTGEIQLADDVTIGPGCTLAGRIQIGPGTTLVSGAHLHGPLRIGEGNVLYPGSCIGFAPQDLKFDPASEGAGTVIGDRNTFRENVTIHRATGARPTTIGSRNYFMAGSHAGHDVRVADDCILANGTLLGGFVEVGNRVVFGGSAAVHQFVRIGRGSMLSGLVGTGLDLCPFFTLFGTHQVGGVNIVGMRRAGHPRSEIDAVRWCFKVLVRSGLPPKTAVERLEERGDEPIVREMIDFVRSSKRGICTGRSRADRLGTVKTLPKAEFGDD